MTLHLTMNCIIGEAGKRYHRMRVWYTGCATIPEPIDLSDQNGTSRSVPTFPAAIPNLPCKFGSPLRWCGPNHLHGRGYAHCIRIPLHAHHGRKPLAQTLGTTSRIILAGPSADSTLRKHNPELRIARPAIPDQILRRGVLLVSIQVAQFYI